MRCDIILLNISKTLTYENILIEENYMKKLLRLLTIALIPISICVAFAIVILIFNKIKTFDKEELEVTSSSTLMDVLDISELSTAQFTYNGIAEIPDENDSDTIKCRIYYHATVKAGINTDEIYLDIDEENKTIIPQLPEISVTANLVDGEELQYIPDDIKQEELSLADAREICKQDAQNEAIASGELFDLAEENLKNAIEALLYPVVNNEGYRIVWSD